MLLFVQAIQERIKELDFQECKVRVSNVDSQASYDSIVIQVIGEISNKSGEPKKFVQTFVLAQQPAGYFLLNDILRYINEGEEETAETAAEETTATVEAENPEELPVEAEPEKTEAEEISKESPAPLDAEAVDKKLEDTTSAAKESASVSAVETPAESVQASTEAHSKPEEVEAAPVPEKVEQQVAAEEAKQPDVPKEPSPTPAPAAAPAPARTPAPEPEKPKEPPKPMTWASRAAAAAGPVKPVVPLPAKTAAAAPAQSRSAAPTAAAAPAPAQTSAPAQSTETPSQSASKEANEWRTAGADSKRQNRQSTAPPTEKEGTLAYVKFVTDKVKDDELRSALGAYGELVYFDINRSKVRPHTAPLHLDHLLTLHRIALSSNTPTLRVASPPSLRARS